MIREQRVRNGSKLQILDDKSTKTVQQWKGRKGLQKGSQRVRRVRNEFATSSQRVRNGFAMGSQWVRNGFAMRSTCSQQVRNGFAMGSQRARNGFATGSQWVRNGFATGSHPPCSLPIQSNSPDGDVAHLIQSAHNTALLHDSQRWRGFEV